GLILLPQADNRPHGLGIESPPLGFCHHLLDIGRQGSLLFLKPLYALDELPKLFGGDMVGRYVVHFVLVASFGANRSGPFKTLFERSRRRRRSIDSSSAVVKRREDVRARLGKRTLRFDARPPRRNQGPRIKCLQPVYPGQWSCGRLAAKAAFWAPVASVWYLDRHSA